MTPEELPLPPMPKVGQRLEKEAHFRDGNRLVRGTVTGVVVAVGEDRFAGWVAVVRWWYPSRAKHAWDVVQALDLLDLGVGEPRARVVP